MVAEGLGKEELCAVAPRGWMCPSPGRYQGYGFQASGENDGWSPRLRDTVYSAGATCCGWEWGKKQRCLLQPWGKGQRRLCWTVETPGGALVMRISTAQSAERGSPNHSLGYPTGARARERCEGFWEHIG